MPRVGGWLNSPPTGRTAALATSSISETSSVSRPDTPASFSEQFQAQVLVASGIGNRVLLRGCRPRIWVNGVRTVNAEVDEVAAPSEIDGLEIYPSIAGTPAQYMDRENRGCGTVIIWTRR